MICASSTSDVRMRKSAQQAWGRGAPERNRKTHHLSSKSCRIQRQLLVTHQTDHLGSDEPNANGNGVQRLESAQIPWSRNRTNGRFRSLGCFVRTAPPAHTPPSLTKQASLVLTPSVFCPFCDISSQLLVNALLFFALLCKAPFFQCFPW